jgi:hypothetical protein
VPHALTHPVHCTFDHGFFTDGRLDKAVALVLRLAAGPGGVASHG